MKNPLIGILIFGALFHFSTNTYSQQDTNNRWNFFTNFKNIPFYSNDTVVKRGIKFRVTNLGIHLNVGARKYFYDSKTEKYFGKDITQSTEVFIYYKNLFLGGFASSSTIKVKDTLYFTAEPLNKDELLNISRMGFLFGYNINLLFNFSVAPYIHWLGSSFWTEHKDYDINTGGFGAGFYLNKFIPLQPKRYFVIFINGNYNQSNYSEFNSALGDYFYTISFGIGYKAWFLKGIGKAN